MKRVAIYVRVSKAEQAEMYSPAAQERACRARSDSEGWVVYHVYTDSLSGKNDQRPGFQQLVADAGNRT